MKNQIDIFKVKKAKNSQSFNAFFRGSFSVELDLRAELNGTQL